MINWQRNLPIFGFMEENDVHMNGMVHFSGMLSGSLPTNGVDEKNRNGQLITLHNLPHSDETRAELDYLICTKKVDLNTVDDNDMTLLTRLCKSNSDVDLALKLIYVEAKLDIQDKNSCTALHYAIENRNKIVIRALLAKGVNFFGHSDLKRHRFHRDLGLLKILIELLNQPSINTVIHTNDTVRSLIALKYNPNPDESESTLEIECSFLLLCSTGNVNLFQFLWNQSNLISFQENNTSSVLYYYLVNCKFARNDWLNCLKVMLTSDIAYKLMQDFRKLTNDVSNYRNLIYALHKKKVKRSDRLELLQLWLSLGAPTTIIDVEQGLQLFGYDQEVDFFIYNSQAEYFNQIRCNNLVVNIICGTICDVNYKDLFFEYSIGGIPIGMNIGFIIFDGYHLILAFVFKNFTMSMFLKEQLKKVGVWNIPDKYLMLSPQFVPLQELSRNVFRNHIKKYFKPSCPREFFEIIDKLKVPEHIRDYLKLKPCALDRYDINTLEEIILSAVNEKCPSVINRIKAVRGSR